MRIAILSQDQRRRCALALAGLAAATAIGLATTKAHAQTIYPRIPFVQSVDSINPNLPGAGPAPHVDGVVGWTNPQTSTIALGWTRYDEGANRVMFLSCSQPTQPDDIGEACDVELEYHYAQLEPDGTFEESPDITSFGAQRNDWYMIEQSADGAWRSVVHIRLNPPCEIMLPVVSR